MKLITYTILGLERVGAYTDQGIVDLKNGCERYADAAFSTAFADMRSTLASGERGLATAKEIVNKVLDNESHGSRVALSDSCMLSSGYRLKAPVTRPDKILCPAVNYVEHGKESGRNPPTEPYFFAKFVNTLIGHEDVIWVPKISKMPDYELELAAVIGTRGKHISKSDAEKYVAGYTILNDVSLRDLQGWPASHPKYGPHWMMGKSADTTCPLGPWIVTHDELPSGYPLKMKLSVNGIVRQDSNTSEQVFKVPELVAYLSQVMTLEPGDIISTGTPGGVGRTTGVFLQEGDKIECEIEHIGVLRNSVRYEPS